MEVQYEEVNGVQDLQPRQRSIKSQLIKKIDSSSSMSSDSSDITDGENMAQDTAVIEQPSSHSQDGAMNVSHNGESNGFTKEQNKDGVIEFPTLLESNGGDEETDIGAIASSFSKSPETASGLKYAESLFNESSKGVNGMPSDGENIVNKTLNLSGQNEINEASGSQEIEVGVDEYDVERVIHNQESHYLICPHCNRDITKRVILRRRKRKRGDILEGVEDTRVKPDQTKPSISPGEDQDIKKGKHENESQVPSTSNGCIDAISCFSCFSVFVPKGDGFLWWRFTPKPAATIQPDDPSAVDTGSGESATDDQSAGNAFPLWILTCCQPYHTEKPVPKPYLIPPSTSDDGKKRQPNDSEPPQSSQDIQESSGSQSSVVPNTDPELPTSSKPGEESPSPPTPEPHAHVAPGEGEYSPLWFVTCCQPSENRTKAEHVPNLDKSVDLPHQPPTLLDSDSTLTPKDKPLVKPTEDESLTSTQAPTTLDHAFPFWFVTCCQPSADGNKPKPGTKLGHEGTKVVSPGVGAKDESEGTASQHPETEPPSGGKHPNTEPPSDDIPVPVPPMAEPPNISETWQPILPKPLPYIPKLDIPSAGEPVAPPTPPKGDIPPATSSNAYSTELPSDLEQPLLGHPSEIARARDPGIDIIKAIVYGGLVECITSLSVITSAAGGDATTLNIVALGLANVCGGLILLLHNLRVLRHEHSAERYEDQLGRPGHFLLHAIVAVFSYLIFGLMSPIIYGFAFRKSDNKDYKLAALAAASLFCIAILSIGKAYVRRPPKAYFQTFFYYVSMAFMVSGVGYVAGDLINMLLKKLGVFDSRAAPAALSEAWITY